VVIYVPSRVRVPARAGRRPVPLSPLLSYRKPVATEGQDRRKRSRPYTQMVPSLNFLPVIRSGKLAKKRSVPELPVSVSIA